ncbi:hypothetical protein Plhal710r2_c015g0065711 [Plasmopara halstedii]
MRAHLRSVLDPCVEYGFHSADLATDAKDVDNLFDERNALRARLLIPQEIPLETYRDRLSAQRGDAVVPAMQTTPVVSAPGKIATDIEELFER